MTFDRSSVSPSLSEKSTSTFPPSKRPAPYSKLSEQEHTLIRLVTTPTVPRDLQQTPMEPLAMPLLCRRTSPSRESLSTPLFSIIPPSGKSKEINEVMTTSAHLRSTLFSTHPKLLNDLTILGAPQTHNFNPTASKSPFHSEPWVTTAHCFDV